MNARQRFAWVLGALLAASAAIGYAEDPSSASRGGSERAAATSLERLLERLERAVSRLEARLDGRRSDSIMEGHEGHEGMTSGGGMMGGGMMDGMMGGGMMGGARPNERWRSPGSSR